MADDDALTGTADKLGPWTIKVMPKEVRDIAVAAARNEGLTVGQWLERVIRERVAEDRPSPVTVASPPASIIGLGNLGDLAALLKSASVLAQDAGVPVTKKLARKGLAVASKSLDAVSQALSQAEQPPASPSGKPPPSPTLEGKPQQPMLEG